MIAPTITSPSEAVAALEDRMARVATEWVSLEEACGRVLADPVLSDRPSPPCDVSAMDGYAVRAEEFNAGPLPVDGELAIGRRPKSLLLGHALRIVTGAPIPPGADAVVRVEDTTCDVSGRVHLREAKTVQPLNNIRFRGENLLENAEVCDRGEVIHAGTVTALATFGHARVHVYRRVRVVVLATGDELVAVGDTPDEFCIRDSNGPALEAALRRYPWLDVVRAPRVVDDSERLLAAICDALASADALILTGGVSMGGKDYVPDSLVRAGAEVLFHRLPQRPGHPVLGAVAPGGRPVFGLPGNPLSGLITARRMVVPTLARQAGFSRSPGVPSLSLEPGDGSRGAPDPSASLTGFWWHRLVRLGRPGWGALVPGRGSGDVVSAARSDGFVEVPPGQSGSGPWPFYAW